MSDKKLEKGQSKSEMNGKNVDSEDEGDRSGSGSDDEGGKKKSGKKSKKDKDDGHADNDKKEGSYELIAKWLITIDKTIDKIMDNGQTLPPAAWDDLRAMRQKVEGVQKAIERSDVAALLELEKVNWNWATDKEGNKNYPVTYFRAAAMKTQHKNFEFKTWHMPQYFSEAPLPPQAYDKNVLVSATVKLPEELKPTMEKTKVSIGPTDTALKLICSLFTKLKVPVGENDYVLKCRATNEYLEGSKLVFNYAYVRRCIRDAFDMEFSLVKRPVPPEVKDKKFEDLAVEYKAKVDAKVVPLQETDYQKLSLAVDWSTLKEFPMAQLTVPFRVMVQGVENCVSAALPRLGSGGCDEVFVESFLFHGMNKIEASISQTSKADLMHSPRFMQWLMGGSQDLQLNSLPRETKIAFLLWGRPKSDKEKAKDGDKKDDKKDAKPSTGDKKAEEHGHGHGGPLLLGWVVQPIINERGVLLSGPQTLRLWSVAGKDKDDHGHGAKRNPADEPDFIFRATTREENCKRAERAVLRLDFGKFVLPVVSPLTPEPREPDAKVVGPERKVSDLKSNEKTQYDFLIASDTLEKLTPDHKRILWTFRHTLKQHPKMLPKFLQSVNWGNRDCVLEAHKLMNAWAPPMEHVHALQLVDARFPDYKVREYAVNVIGRMRDNELNLYLLQLVQCLKFEPYHDSPLARFLIERALANPLEVGHPLFWHLKAEMHNPEWCERFGLLIEEYLSHAGPAASHLRKQLLTVHKLQKVAEMVVRLKPTYRDEDLRGECRKELEKLNREFFIPMGKFQVPFNPKLEATTLIVEKCRYMSSKMVPLWLLFKNADPDAPPIYILFKSGDDLRQDILTLQMLRVMDSVWLQNKWDLKMRPYAVCATGVNSHGKGVGMLEIVTNSDTTAGIQNDFGGGAMGALKSAPIDDFIKAHNKENYAAAVETFLRSCAGYCVATFVLGIGDRHNGNIMVTKTGSLFHIDFGHFLGNFKKKKIAGVNFEREKAAFVFTKAMAFVMGGQEFKKHPLFKRFLNFCFEAFKTLRRNADTLENLFILMIPAGMPELIVEKDIEYMRKKLALDKSEKDAEGMFNKEVDIALDHTYRAIDNMIHIWKNA